MSITESTTSSITSRSMLSPLERWISLLTISPRLWRLMRIRILTHVFWWRGLQPWQSDGSGCQGGVCRGGAAKLGCISITYHKYILGVHKYILRLEISTFDHENHWKLQILRLLGQFILPVAIVLPKCRWFILQNVFAFKQHSITLYLSAKQTWKS